jgi:flagellar assembly factor FliW
MGLLWNYERRKNMFNTDKQELLVFLSYLKRKDEIIIDPYVVRTPYRPKLNLSELVWQPTRYIAIPTAIEP